MRLLVDTSVWSLALRRPAATDPDRRVSLLTRAIESPATVCLTGLILQEVLQGLRRERQARALERQLRSFPLVQLDRADYVLAAEVFTTCRAHGAQVGTADAQIAAAALRHRCALLTTDRDFLQIARHF